MKKLITMWILAAVMTAAFTSCGKIEEPGAANIDPAEDSRTAETEAPEESEPDTDEPEESSAPEESQPEETTTTKQEIEIPDRTEPTISEHDWFIQMIDKDYVFDDEYSFGELYEKGLANAYGESKAYAAVPQSGGAGHMYYNVYSTEDGGKSWSEAGVYDEINGNNKHFALEDGGIMLFSLNSPREETYPVVIYLYFDGEGIKSAELKEYLAQTVLGDGRLLSEADNIDYEVTYRYEYVFDIIIIDNDSGEVLCDKEFDLQYAKAYALESDQYEPEE